MRDHSTRSPDLSASLSNIRVLQGRFPAIELDFVLTNQSKHPLHFAERWNSWGAFQWRFKLVDGQGECLWLGRPRLQWSTNFLTTFTIFPGKTHRESCYLYPDIDNRDPESQGKAGYTISGFTRLLHKAELSPGAALKWHYPILLVGEFSSSEAYPVSPRSRLILPGCPYTWTGGVLTDLFRIDTIPRIMGVLSHDSSEGRSMMKRLDAPLKFGSSWPFVRGWDEEVSPSWGIRGIIGNRAYYRYF